MALADLFPKLSRAPVKYLREVAPGVHAFGTVQPMSRVRSYQTNVLSPIGGRGAPTETVLVGHLHTDASGQVESVESFISAGSEGRTWAENAFQELGTAGLLAPNAALRLDTPTRGCPHSGR